jgi:vitamin B12 transporter
MINDRLTIVAALAAAITALPERSDAQQVADTATVLDPVIVTATKLPTPRNQLPSSVSVLSGEQLRAQGIRSVHEALRTVAGLNVVETSSFGSATSLFVRGAESDYVKVLVDGVPLNLPGGSIDLANLTLDNIERIEVVRGPTSVLYGSDAVAGVVQLFTAAGRGPMRANLGVRGGTHSSIVVDADIVGGAEELGYSLGFSRAASDGLYDFNSEYDNLALSGSVGYRPDSHSDARLSLRYGDSEYHYPTDGSGLVVDHNAHQLQDRVTVALDAGRRFGRIVGARLSLAVDRLNSGINDASDGPADTLGFFGYESEGRILRRSADLRGNLYAPRAAVITAGLHIERQDERTVGVSQSEFGPARDSLIANRMNLGYYAQLQAQPVNGAAVVAGLRLDDNGAFGTFVTYRAGVSYRAASGTRLRGSVGRAFKEPTFLENYGNGPFAIGNPDLVPERSLSWEVGLEQGLWDGRLELGGAYFAQRFRDMIQYTFATANPGDPNYMNVAAADASGIELTFRAGVGAGLTLGGDYTYLATAVTDAGFDSDRDDAFVVGERLLRRPTNHVSAFARYRFPGDRLLLGLRIDHVGDRDDRDFSQFPTARVTLPSYTRVDLNGAIKIVSRRSAFLDISLSGRVENLFDRQYQEVVGFPARGRVVFFGGKIGI